MADPKTTESDLRADIQDMRVQRSLFGPPLGSCVRRPQTILCVDGTESNRYVRARLLRSEGFEVVEAGTGSDALRLAAETQPSLVLLDILLPDLNGFEVCRRLKSNPKTFLIPVLHISTLGQADHDYPEARSGAEAYLREPVEPSVLIAVITALIRAASADAGATKAERDAIDILERVGEAMYLLDQDYRYEYVNAEAERLIGLERTALIGKTLWEAFPASTGTLLDRELRRVMNEQTPSLFENFYEPWQRWFEVKASPVSGGGIAVHFRDITGPKRAEQTLRDSEERFRTLFENMSEGFALHEIITDEHGRPSDYRFLDVNPAFELLTGLKRTNVLGRRVLEVMPDLESHWITTYGEVALTGNPARFENYSAELDRWYEVFAYRPAPRQFAAIFSDISLRRRAEQTLRDSEERLRLAQEVAGVGTFEWNIQTGVNTWTPKLEQLYGLRVGSFGRTQTSWENLVHPEDRARAVELVNEAFESGEPVEGEWRVIWPDGSVHWLSARWQVFKDPSGVPLRMTGVNIDITERKQSEERLRHTQKLESLGLLAGGVAHDFNNLLIGVIGNASLAQEMLPPDHPAAEFMQTVVRTGEQAAHLTRQMLAYAGKGKFLVERLDMSGLVRDIIELVRPSIPKKIALNLDLEKDLPAIEADRGQVQQILMNLVLNAAEAIGSHDGQITVRTATQLLGQDYLGEHPDAAHVRPGEYVILEVRDTGSGMDEAVKAKIFDPFFSTKFTGRGLGLAAVAGIVRSHEGGIVVTSSPGKGSTFSVLFPAAAQRAERTPDVAPSEEARGSGVVLIIDDEQVVRDMAKHALERHGYTVLVAEAGLAAIDILKRHPDYIDLALLDLSMAGTSGDETLLELRKIRPDVKVLVSSGYSEAEAMAMFRGQRVSGFIQKPYTSALLAQAVKGVLR